LLGSALRNKGIQPLLDGVGTFLPSPLEVVPAPARNPQHPEIEIPLASDSAGPLCALAFKVLSDEGRKLTYLRIYSGTLKAGDAVWISNRGCHEKVARLFRMHAHRRERLDEAGAGDIVAAAGLKSVLTGDTLCRADQPLLLAGLSCPEPVVSLAVEPKGGDDRDKLLPSLEKLQWEDPTFKVREDAETGQTILVGMGELHLEVIVTRLARDFGVEVKTGRPQVVYRETLSQPVEWRERFHREVDGRIQEGEVLLRLTPLARGEGLQLKLPDEDASPLPAEFHQLLQQSLTSICSGGTVAGYPLIDLSVEVLEVPFVSGLTTELGLRAAAQRGVMMAAREGRPLLLEPVMRLELLVPGEYAGKVLGSLQQKRGRVEGMLSRGDLEVIRARVPLIEMFGYMTELRSATKGRGTFSMEFSHYDDAPAEVLKRFGLR
jgi:elongation factor G